MPQNVKCPGCNIGLRYDQDREESWRVASLPLDEYEVEWFRIFKEHGRDDE